MRFLGRLDVQLALLVTLMLGLALALSGWVHSGQLIVWKIDHQPHAATQLEAINDRLTALPAGEEEIQAWVSGLEAAPGSERYIYLLLNDRYEVAAHSAPAWTFIEFARPDAEAGRFSVMTSLIRDHSNLSGVFHGVPAAEIVSRGGSRYHLLVLPDPAVQEEMQYKPFFVAGVINHIRDLAWYYVLALVLVILVIRWRLRPLRQLEAVAGKLNLREIPEPVTETGNRDEVGELVRAFNMATRRLGDDEQMRRRLFSDLSHEIRTPLTSLSGRLEAYEDGLVDDKDALIAFAGKQVSLLARLVEDMSLVSLADAGEMKLELEAVEPATFIRGYLADEATQYGFEWQVAGTGPVINIDLWRFRQILVNLTSNAVRARPDGLKISVDVAEHGHAVIIGFKDNGPGVPEEHLPRLFDRMYRPDESRQGKTGGSGLGLSIVRSLVEAHGGAINCLTGGDGGLRFEISLPLAESSVT